MKKLKKVLAMIICSMMVFSLVGCDNSSNGNSDAPSASDNGGNTQDPNATPKPITLETAIDINKLSDAKKFSEAGYSDKILKLDSKEGVCIGKYDLSIWRFLPPLTIPMRVADILKACVSFLNRRKAEDIKMLFLIPFQWE